MWVRRQTDGELDEQRLVDGLIGQNIYPFRVEPPGSLEIHV